MTCKNCGSELKEDVKFCTNCGEPVLKSNSKRKKSRKKVIILVAVISVALIGTVIAIASSGSNNGSHTNSDNYYDVDDFYEDYFDDYYNDTDDYEQSPDIIEESLADNCQYLLVTGYDSDGTCYQLVGEDYENYDKSIIRFGVIKDNQWLVEMTSDIPFIDEYNCIYGGLDENGNYELEGYASLRAAVEKSSTTNIYDRFGYAGNGCFYLKSNITSNTITIVEQLHTIVFWNAETNSEKIINNAILSDIEYYNSDNDLLLSVLGEHLFAISNNQFADMNVQALNTKNLESKTLFTQRFNSNSSWSKYKIYQCSENLFYVEKDNSFYNMNGDKAFELPVKNTQEIGHFYNGQCEIINQIENGARFRIIIDKSGNVISDEKISD